MIKNKIKKRIILAGTPEFASNIFQEIIKHFDVVGIVSQPDRPSGRGKHIHDTPVKTLAIDNNIKLFQPTKITNITSDLELLNPDLIVTCAYGQYIPLKILNIPKHKSVNIHASLLPKYRGAAPIHYSILSGDTFTGITMMLMSNKMDCGDMLFKAKIKILNKTSSELFLELSSLAKNNIIEWLTKYFNDDYVPVKQIESQATYSKKINKNESEILHTDSIKETIRKIQAFDKFPGTYIIYKGKKLKVFKASIKEISNSIVFKLSDGNIYITEVQSPGKKRMETSTFLRGLKNG